MRIILSITIFTALLAAPQTGVGSGGQRTSGDDSPAVLDQRIAHFHVSNASLLDGLAELSRFPNLSLHLGIEEALREKFDSRQDRSVPFSVDLADVTVRQLLDALCDADKRYAWSTDGSTVNVYPKARVADTTDLLNFRIDEIQLKGIPNPDEALTPLSKMFPNEQVGYMQAGMGDYSYASPWTVTLDNLTVRQLANRLAEHMGPNTAWDWQGGKDGRVFTFIKGGFNTH